MYLPEWLNLMSLMDEMISEKKLRVVGSSGSSKTADRMWRAEQIERQSTFAVPITQCRLAHVAQTNHASRTAVDEKVAFTWVKFGTRDHFSEIFHIGWFYIDDI